MAKENQSKALSTLKTVLIAGYAVSLFVPYKVEKHDGETTYHAPLYKLSYKTGKVETTEKDAETKNAAETKEQIVHTYTVTSFGLLNDQIATAQRLYKAALLKRPVIEEKARASARAVSQKTKDTAMRVALKAKNTAKALKQKAESIRYPYIVEDVTDKLDTIIENVLY